MNALTNCQSEEQFSELLEAERSTFTCSLSDGSVVELCDGGEERNLEWSQRFEYARLVEAARMKETQKQVSINLSVIAHVFRKESLCVCARFVSVRFSCMRISADDSLQKENMTIT